MPTKKGYTLDDVRKLRAQVRVYRKALKEIAHKGDGIKENMRDYTAITTGCKFVAQVALKPNRCVCCGRNGDG